MPGCNQHKNDNRQKAARAENGGGKVHPVRHAHESRSAQPMDQRFQTIEQAAGHQKQAQAGLGARIALREVSQEGEVGAGTGEVIGHGGAPQMNRSSHKGPLRLYAVIQPAGAAAGLSCWGGAGARGCRRPLSQPPNQVFRTR